MQQANSNADNMKLVVAVLCAALYPNVVQVMTPEAKYTSTAAGAVQKAPKAEQIKFMTKGEGYVSMRIFNIKRSSYLGLFLNATNYYI